MKYCLDTPYPKIIVDKPNLKDALLILNSYAGEISENTASHLYLYQSFSLKEEKKKFSKVLEEISIVEMRHLELLANAINLLGLAPAFVSLKDNKIIPWTSNYINYTLDLKKMLEFNIQAETEAIKQYYELIESLENESIKKLIERIIQDEEVHITIFKDMLKEI